MIRDKGQITASQLGNTRQNLALNSGMMVDGGSGTPTNFTYYSQNCTITKTVNANGTTLAMTASTQSGNNSYAVFDQIIGGVNPNDIVSISVDTIVANIVGGFKGYVELRFLDALNIQVGSLHYVVYTNTSKQTQKIENKIAPVNTAKVKITLTATATNAGDTGSVTYNNLLVEKASSVGNYISTGCKSTLSANSPLNN
jgi:hypothetical protein